MFTWNNAEDAELDAVLATSIASVAKGERFALLEQGERDGILIEDGVVVVVRDADSPRSTRTWHNSILTGVGSLNQPSVDASFRPDAMESIGCTVPH